MNWQFYSKPWGYRDRIEDPTLAEISPMQTRELVIELISKKQSMLIGLFPLLTPGVNCDGEPVEIDLTSCPLQFG
jgi:hypothetical protein